jgi:hypothetical protein
MSDFDNLVPLIAAHIGVAPSTLLLLMFILHRAAIFLSRRIPNDAIGWQANVRTVASWFALDPSAVITSTPAGPVSVQDVAARALTVPPIPQAVAAEKGVPVADVIPTTPYPLPGSAADISNLKQGF